MGFRERLSELVGKRASGNKTGFARLCGVEAESVRQWLNGQSMPSIDKAVAVATACGVSLDWLLLDKNQEQFEETSTVLIQKLTFRPSAGAGMLLQYNEPDTVAVPRQVLQRLNLPERKARLLNAAGDSMMPTIQDGEPLIIEVDVEMLLDGKIYVFTIDENVYVKRLRRGPGHLVMISDNPDWPTREEQIPNSEHFALIGRVRWVGRTL
ncbi:putative HTH-type transcriptional regulator [Afipia felis]